MILDYCYCVQMFDLPLIPHAVPNNWVLHSRVWVFCCRMQHSLPPQGVPTSTKSKHTHKHTLTSCIIAVCVFLYCVCARTIFLCVWVVFVCVCVSVCVFSAQVCCIIVCGFFCLCVRMWVRTRVCVCVRTCLCVRERACEFVTGGGDGILQLAQKPL